MLLVMNDLFLSPFIKFPISDVRFMEFFSSPSAVRISHRTLEKLLERRDGYKTTLSDDVYSKFQTSRLKLPVQVF